MKITWRGAASTNFSKGRKLGSVTQRPEAIVIHVMDGSFVGTRAWFGAARNKGQSSTHYGISLTGEIDQYVKEEDTAYHAGNVHPFPPKWKGFNGSNPNATTIGIEHEGKADTIWPQAMYEASAELIRDICDRWNIPIDRDHIIGHKEIYSLKACPGKCDLDKLVRMAKEVKVSV